jgi:hypothetical protein
LIERLPPMPTLLQSFVVCHITQAAGIGEAKRCGYRPLYRVLSISHGWFDTLPEYVRDDVLARARKRTLNNGQRLYSRGDDADGLYCVCKGAVRISGISGDGSTWFGEVSLLDGLPRVHDADWAKQGITTGTNRQRTCWQF